MGTHRKIGEDTIFVDTIEESTPGGGVILDGVLLKDSQVYTDIINEKTTGAGVTPDGVLMKDAELLADNMPGWNALINGDFAVWQRGTSFTAATVPLNSDDTYLMDRWILLSDGNDRVDVTREATVVPDGALYAVKFEGETLTAGPNSEKFGIISVLENRDAVKLWRGGNGKASLSFDARTTSGQVENVRAAVIAWDGAADSVTSDIISAWAVEGTNPTLVANWTYENTPIDIVLSNVYQTFKIEGIDLDTAATKNLAVFLWVDDTDIAAGDLLYVGKVKLEPGSKATPFLKRSYVEELLLCQRYYGKTYNGEVDPGTSTAVGMQQSAFNALLSSANRTIKMTWHFPVEMRATPTAKSYAQAGTADKVTMAGGEMTAIISNAGSRSVTIGGADTATTTSGSLNFQATAEAEL